MRQARQHCILNDDVIDREFFDKIEANQPSKTSEREILFRNRDFVATGQDMTRCLKNE